MDPFAAGGTIFCFVGAVLIVGFIFIANAITFNIEATGTRWDLYMGAVTTTPGLWDNVQLYGTSGTAPTVDMIKLRVHNLGSTPLISGFVPLQDINFNTG